MQLCNCKGLRILLSCMVYGVGIGYYCNFEGVGSIWPNGGNYC